MSTLTHLLKKEFRQIFRNTTILRLIIAMPIMQLIVMPLAADYEIKNINISIVDHDRSDYSRELVSKIQSSGYFKLNDYGNSFDKSFDEFQKDRSDLILEIPLHFEKTLHRENTAALLIAVNAINGTKAAVGSAYLSQILTAYNAHIRTNLIPQQKFSAVPSTEIRTLHWFNPMLSYPIFMVPGILVLLVTMVGVYMCSLNIVKEKEMGTIEQINVSPVKKSQFLLAKLIPFWVIGMVVFSIGLFGVARLVYDIVSVGSLWALYSYLAIYLIALLGVGLLISTYSNTQQQAMSLAFFSMMIFILMSGLFTSIDSMPEWAKWVAKINPVTYFIEVVRLIVLKGSGFSDILPHTLITLLMGVFFNGWALLNYRKTN